MVFIGLVWKRFPILELPWAVTMEAIGSKMCRYASCLMGLAGAQLQKGRGRSVARLSRSQSHLIAHRCVRGQVATHV